MSKKNAQDDARKSTTLLLPMAISVKLSATS